MTAVQPFDFSTGRYAVPVGEDLDRLEWLAPQVEDGARRLAPDGVAADVLARTNEFVISTDGEALDGDIIDQGSWRLDQYRANPVVLNLHRQSEVVGRALAVEVVDNELRALVEWDESELNPTGRLVAHQHQMRFRQATSIWWRSAKRTERHQLPDDHPKFKEAEKRNGFFGPFMHSGFFFEENTLLEASSVSVPSDPRALQLRSAPSGTPLRELLDQVPDRGVSTALEDRVRAALLDPELYASTAFVEQVRSLVLRFIRTDDECRTALEALGLAPSPPQPEPVGLAAWLSPAFAKESP